MTLLWQMQSGNPGLANCSVILKSGGRSRLDWIQTWDSIGGCQLNLPQQFVFSTSNGHVSFFWFLVTRKWNGLFVDFPEEMYWPLWVYLFRYKVGQWFGSHIDESVDLGGGNRTHYTLLIYLSGGSSSKATSHPRNAKGPSLEPLVGGETVFYGSRNKVVAEVMFTCFLSDGQTWNGCYLNILREPYQF